MTKKIYVIDTSVYLTDFSSLKAFEDNDIIIPFKVLEEIDKHKKRQDSVGSNARNIIRTLDELRQLGSLHEGVSMGEGYGIVTARGYDAELLPIDWDKKDPDNQIIATALTVKEENPECKVTLVSRDINLRVKCDSIGLLTDDYQASQIIESLDEIYAGYRDLVMKDREIDKFYAGDDIYAPLPEEGEEELNGNEFLVMTSEINEKKSALARFKNYNTPLLKIPNKRKVWGIGPRNKEQTYALELLMDPSISLVSLVGKAGSGDDHPMSTQKSIYTRLIVSRPVEPLGKDIGFLPGTMEEKMEPWLKPIQDNLKFLMVDDSVTLQEYMEIGKIEVEALTYIRGRSISNAFIIIDEAQNLTKHELKTIVTRVGEGTKLILTGDVEQIDNIYIDERTNGLTYAVEKMKEHEITGHITLKKGERSAIATLGSKIL
jgi:PhoH-like ATPase